jgi:epoxyqueuosine reductase
LSNTTKQKNTAFIKSLSEKFGFLACGISQAQKLEEEEKPLTEWLNRGYHGKMKYMENHFDKRLDPSKLVPGAKSVISLLLNYAQEETTDSAVKISKYAWGEDYHSVIKNKLFLMVQSIKEEIGDINGRVFVDSAPVLERQWAAKSGLGWIGKHGLLLRKQEGSFFFIAQIICDLDLETDQQTTDHCGECTACIDACPTNAIVANKLVDSNKCISYLTIELHENTPEAYRDKLNGWAYGCDICQDVCPWNKFSTQTQVKEFQKTEHSTWQEEEWTEMTESIFDSHFEKSAIKRIGASKMKQNIANILKK